MRNLLRLLSRYRHVLLFLGLEMIAFVLLVQNNNYHKTSFVNASSDVTGKLYEWRNNITDYLHLRESNEVLTAENARLYTILARKNNIELEEAYKLLNDTIRGYHYLYQDAKVINNSIHMANNNITINRGRRHGVEVDMGVIGPKGMVGFVTHVSENYAVLASALNVKKFNVNARTRKASYSGLVVWEGYNAQELKLKEVPSFAPLSIGDTVVTNASSGRFPDNIPIGIITEVNTVEGSEYQEAYLKPTTDFANLRYVYIIHNIYRSEQIKLEAAAAIEP